MNEKQHHCIMTRNRLIFLAVALLALHSISAHAQPKPRFEAVQNRNYYIGGNNIAGMRMDTVSVSQALVQGSYTFGENRKGFEAPETWTAAASAASIYHLKKFSMYGNFSFTQTMGYRMFTSMMINPGRYPIDILEFTAGTKSRQNYAFAGGISVDVAPRWRVGARVDFSATNYAKLKDLRYTDYGLDFNLRPGFQYLGDKFTIGAALSVVRNAETIRAEQVGESETAYYAFLNKGSWYGVRQIWTGGGVHLSETGINGFPVAENGAGASAQLQWKGLYAELAYLHTDGRVGEKDAVWFTFPVDKFDLTLAWRQRSDAGVVHTFRVDAGFKNTVLDEAVMDKITEGGVTIRHTYAWNTIQRKQNYNLMASWTGVKAGKFSARGHIMYVREDLDATIQYPRIDTHCLQIMNMNGSLSWFFDRNWSLDATLIYGMGFYTDDTILATTDITSPTELYRSPRDYANWKLQVTKPYVSLKLAPRYTFPMNLYLSVDIATEYKVLPVELKNCFRTTAGLSLGYIF